MSQIRLLKKYLWALTLEHSQTSCKRWLASGERRRCSNNEAKMRNPLKFARVPRPQTPELISAACGPKFAIYCGDMWRRYCYLTYFFPIVNTCLTCKDSARQSCATVRRWRFFASFLRIVFPASRMPHISNLHSKFALRPHTMCRSMVDIHSANAEIRRGKKQKDRNHTAKI